MVGKIDLESMLDESGFNAATEMGGLSLYKVPEVSLVSYLFGHPSSLHQNLLEQLLKNPYQILLFLLIP